MIEVLFKNQISDWKSILISERLTHHNALTIHELHLIQNPLLPLVSVCTIALDVHILVQDHTGKVFRGCLAKGLTGFMFLPGFFRCIDANETDGEFLAIADDGYGIAIGDPGALVLSGMKRNGITQRQ